MKAKIVLAAASSFVIFSGLYATPTVAQQFNLFNRTCRAALEGTTFTPVSIAEDSERCCMVVSEEDWYVENNVKEDEFYDRDPGDDPVHAVRCVAPVASAVTPLLSLVVDADDDDATPTAGGGGSDDDTDDDTGDDDTGDDDTGDDDADDDSDGDDDDDDDDDDDHHHDHDFDFDHDFGGGWGWGYRATRSPRARLHASHCLISLKRPEPSGLFAARRPCRRRGEGVTPVVSIRANQKAIDDPPQPRQGGRLC